MVKLSPYKRLIDDQANSGSLEFFDLATELLEARIDEAEIVYKEILDSPFDFTVDESYEFDPDKKDYVANSQELKERWRRALKYDVMEKVAEDAAKLKRHRSSFPECV